MNLTDKTSQIAEEQLVMTMDKAQEKNFKDTKVNVSVFSAESAVISRWRPIDKASHCSSLQLGRFFENCHKLIFIRRPHVLFSNGFNKNRNEAISKITKEQTCTHKHTHTAYAWVNDVLIIQI